MTVRPIMKGWGLHLLAICVFASAALWNSRAVLNDPATVVTYDPSADFPRKSQRDLDKLVEFAASDLKRGVAQLSYVARILPTAPQDFFTGWMCFPVDGVAFGEHMLADGIIGAPVQVFSDDPVITYNFVATVKPWIAAAGMYALAYHWTSSWGAALLAGFLFGFHPLRLSDAAHPSVVGNEWIPLILLFLDQVFARQRWRDALALALFASVQALSSMYVLIQYALVVGSYGLYLLWKHRTALAAILPRLVPVAAAIAATMAWALGPYLEIRQIWGFADRPGGFQGPPSFFWFGGRYFAGVCLSLLALLGLADRLFGRARQQSVDARLPLSVAALAAVWFLFPIQVPGTQFGVPSLGDLMRSYVPGVAAVRAPDKVFFAVVVPLAVLAAYGFRAVESQLGIAGRGIALAVLAVACAIEVFVPAVARRSFGAALPEATYRLRPLEGDLAAVRNLPPGPVLDLPGNYNFFWIGELSDYVLLGSYHQHRQSSCKASFRTPIQFEVNRIAERLPDADAARELWALGFRSIIFHAQNVERVRNDTDRILSGLADPAAGAHLVPLPGGETIRIARLVADGPITRDFESLSPAPTPRLPAQAGGIGVPFGVIGTEATFRHPDPIQPTELLVTWRAGQTVVHTEIVRGLLPIALAAGRSIDVVVKATAPTALGKYEVTLALADESAHVLGVERITVRPAKPTAAPAKDAHRRAGTGGLP